jgi:hypothetical protein
MCSHTTIYTTVSVSSYRWLVYGAVTYVLMLRYMSTICVLCYDMSPHTIIYVCPRIGGWFTVPWHMSSCYDMCPMLRYVSSYYYICVSSYRWLVYGAVTYVLMLRYVSSCYDMCPHTTIYVCPRIGGWCTVPWHMSSCYDICLRYMSSCYDICPHTTIYVCPRIGGCCTVPWLPGWVLPYLLRAPSSQRYPKPQTLDPKP